MKTLTLLEWQLIPHYNKGMLDGLRTYLEREGGARVAVVVFDGDKRISWLFQDPLPQQCVWQKSSG